jgi:hypothetical protein
VISPTKPTNLVNKLFPFLAAVIFTSQAGAQITTLFENSYPDKKNSISIDANYFISSNAITNQFTNAYLNQEFLTTEIKDKSLENMKDENVLGNELNAGIYYSHKTKQCTDTNKTGYFVNVRNRAHLDTKFTKDFFELYFYGNKPFEGTTADIGNFNYRHLFYQQLQLGLMKETIKDDKIFGYALSASFLNGQYFLEVKSSDGSLYTYPDGEYIDMNLYLESKESNPARTSFGSSNGLGASADLELHYGIKNKYTFRFTATDLGFITWDSKSYAFEVDTNYHFEGVEVTNLFDSMSFDLKSEFQFKEGFKKNKRLESFTSTLPARLNLSYERTITPEKIIATIGGDYIFNSNYIPLVFLSGDYYFSPKTKAGITFQYGGYGGFHGGIHADFDFGKGFIFSAGTAFLDGYLMPSSSTSQGAYFGFKKIF